MREIFPTKRRGDSLSARHVNVLSGVARRTASGSTGSYRNIRHTGSLDLYANVPYHVQDVVVIRGVHDATNKVYKVRVRYYDHANAKWDTVPDGAEFFLDGKDTDSVFEVDDKVVAFWHSQRSMYVPSPTGVVSSKVSGTDDFWCAQVSECALWREGGIEPASDEDTCCLYRGEIKRYRTPILEGSEDPDNELCEPLREIRPCWIISDCQLELEAGSSWVRKVAEKVSLEWKSENNLVPITEELDVYEWCCWKPEECPATEETMSAVFKRSSTSPCDPLLGVAVQLKYKAQDAFAYPRDHPTCNFDGWSGEFSVQASVPVQLVVANYTTKSGRTRDGWIQPHWLTGKIDTIYRNVAGSPVTESDEISTINSFGGCDFLPSSVPGIPAEQTVTRWYRIKINCDIGAEVPTKGCIQHLYPPGHPIYDNAPAGAGGTSDTLYATGDPQLMSVFSKACINQVVCEIDFDFGRQHRDPEWWTSSAGPVGGDGYFGGEQYVVHTLAGCFDAVEPHDCVFDNSTPLDDTSRPANAKTFIVISW